MALILNIDTATENASICIAKEQQILGQMVNASQKDHAAWLQPAIQELLKQTGISIHQLQAIAVTKGPGSYTGLRVGMASAKGLCFALGIPFIAINTLKVMAKAVLDSNALLPAKQPFLICPMIDARRMEVFTAIYQQNLQITMEPSAITLNEDGFSEQLLHHTIWFTGSGSLKYRSMQTHPNAYFNNIPFNTTHLAALANEQWQLQSFSDLVYTEPEYIKDFYFGSKN